MLLIIHIMKQIYNAYVFMYWPRYFDWSLYLLIIMLRKKIF